MLHLSLEGAGEEEEKRDSFLDRVLTRERGIYWSYRYAMILEVKQME
jgi:hypothetical protein